MNKRRLAAFMMLCRNVGSPQKGSDENRMKHNQLTIGTEIKGMLGNVMIIQISDRPDFAKHLQ